MDFSLQLQGCFKLGIKEAETGPMLETNEKVQAILDSRDRKQAGPTAPPEGLCLMKVDY